ncbi:DUF3450 domain-containing protein [Teredinibacter purpureus]|uniref:DUF3450 domain-containing protein n=1 Tax=Teredinibacter purpureus TaxID=2731756 RepID=UPI0005F81A09|nr:DUF3450 domain-containing protein [Teredinibacter purpureus]
MNKQRIKAVALTTVLSASALFVGAAQADQTLNTIIKVSQVKTTAGQQSQKRVDKLQAEAASLLQKYKIVNKEIAGLKVYNTQLDKQLASQRQVISDLNASIDQVTVIERQIQPLILRMLDGLEQFVQLDVPFHSEERLDRVSNLRRNQDRADISVAEKFRQILEAYNIEAEYGRKLDTYVDSLEVGGQERQVNMLVVGRVALMYQTTDTKLSGAYDKSQGAFVELDAGEYRAAILKGIRIAKKQASIDVLALPVLAPEAAQ